MEPEIGDISSEKVRGELRRLQTLESRILWARVVTQIGGTVCSFWLLYWVFAARGFLLAFLAFVALGFVYKFGVSPMFAVAASVLCFYFNAVGFWLPVTSYVVAAILLYVDLKRDSLRRRVAPTTWVQFTINGLRRASPQFTLFETNVAWDAASIY